MVKQKKMHERFITAHVMILTEDLVTIIKGLHPYGCAAPNFEADATEIVKQVYAEDAEIRPGMNMRIVVDVIADQIIDPNHFNH